MMAMAKYKKAISPGGEILILKDGHTMFIDDIVMDLNRKSFLEQYKIDIESKLNGDSVIMPKALTAENGAKYILSGEFAESIDVQCGECHGDGCIDCDDNGYGLQQVTISWTTIKNIYAMAVKGLSSHL